MNPLAWTRLAAALEFYRGCGYEYHDVEWVVSTPCILATLPPGNLMYQLESGDALIGSGEQGFIYDCLHGHMENGRRMTLTPCFRMENEPYSPILRPWFMKVELWSSHVEDVNKMIDDARRFFSRWIRDISAVDTADGVDLMAGGVELGSYGIRMVSIDGKVFHYAYGTGLAEPRFSVVCSGASSTAAE